MAAYLILIVSYRLIYLVINPLTPELFYQKPKKNDEWMEIPNCKCLLSDYCCFEYRANNERRLVFHCILILIK